MKFDIKELVNYGKQLKSRQDMMTRSVESVGNYLLQTVIKKTPVDTGLLKKTWRTDNPTLKAQKKGNVYEVTIVNTTPYASFVEKGHRKVVFGVDTGGWVMGRFFLKASEVETEKNLEKLILPYLKELFEVK